MGDKAQKRKVKFQVLIVEDDKCTAGIVADILREKGLDCPKGSRHLAPLGPIRP